MRSALARKPAAEDMDGIVGKLSRHLAYVNQRYFHGYPDHGTTVTLGVPAVVQHNGSSGIPAAELRPGANTIVINLALPRLRCPLYVYRYLMFHERLHQVCPPPPGGPVHTDEFRDHEMRAPHRLKAIRWLRKHAFPVLNSLPTD